MKQIIQSFKTGDTILEEVPAPIIKKGQLLIRTTQSLVSSGTERMLVEFGKANLIAKARQQPDKVKMVLNKIKTDGLIPTIEAVFSKLEQSLPLGYCNVGVILEVGEGVKEFKVGDRVASNGNHAEFVCIPQNLVAKIPDTVTNDQAVFTVIASIGLQSIRLMNPLFGETIVVVGLGLIGLITVQLLKANGCNVIAYDLDNKKVELAKSMNIKAFNSSKGNDPVKYILNETKGIGADGVIITASAKTNDIISHTAQMSRKRGKIILVGVIGLDISRADFYEKELSFQVSCSYGPGRYDDDYENKGLDYPLPYVRWTEKRNFESILNAIDSGNIDVNSLITEKIKLNNYQKIYENIGNSKSIASIIEYPQNAQHSTSVQIETKDFKKGKAVIGIVGAGNFTKMTMLPALKETAASLKYIVSAGGVTGTALAKKYNIAYSSTDFQELLNDEDVDIVMIATRHNLHKQMVIKALQANKHVFVEKPLALTVDELKEIESAYKKAFTTLTVGFNRRFSSHIQEIKKALGNNCGPLNIIATMNAGFIPENVWIHDMKIGGGRIIGEACHFIDLITYICGSKVKSVCMNAMGENPSKNTDNASILLQYENGTNATINYFANGSKAYAKERLEVYNQERTIVMDNFRITRGYGVKGLSKYKTALDKGHKKQFANLVNRIKSGGDALIPFDEIINTTKASFAAIGSLKNNAWVSVNN